MARNDEQKEAREVAAAEARAAQEDIRRSVQDAVVEARNAQGEAKKALVDAVNDARRAQADARILGRGGAPGQRGPGPRTPNQRGPEPRVRRGRQPLSRELIVDSAMRLMRSKGLDRLTMRGIAWDLDTGPASLYVHVRNTAELHGLLLDRIIADIELEGEGDAWRDRIASILTQYYLLLVAHPEFAKSALTVKPSGHHYLALIERLLALMSEGGIPPKQSAWGVDVLLLWATAGAVEHADAVEETTQPSPWEALRLAVAHPDTYPHVARAGLDLVSGTGEQRSLWAIEVLLNGIAGTPRAAHPTTTESDHPKTPPPPSPPAPPAPPAPLT